MLYLFLGPDTKKARAALASALKKEKGAEVYRITDAHTMHDLEGALALSGQSGLFGGKRVVVFDSVLAHDEMKERLRLEIPRIGKDAAAFYMLEEVPDAATRKFLEKHAHTTEKFDLPKAKKQDNFFALTNALQKGKKKDLWVLLQEEFHAGKKPEAIHGILFWAAKQSVMRSPSEKTKKMLAELAELPHEARRRGFDLEYALEYFALSIA